MACRTGVYKIEINDKCYVGSTIQSFKTRWNNHLTGLRRNKHHNKHMQNAFNKYGEDALKFTILEIVEKLEDVLTAEQKYIDELKPEYNASPTAGNNYGLKHTETTRQKISKAHKGKIVSDETREKMSEAHAASPELSEKMRKVNIGNKNALGHKLSEEIKRKFSELYKGKKLAEEVKQKMKGKRKGHVVTEETREKISNANKKRWKERKE
jgi:group I intron endonuclease